MKRTLFLSLITASALFTSATAARVRDEKIETKILELPRITAQGVDYSSLTVEYAVDQLTPLGTKLGKGSLACTPKSSEGLDQIKDAQMVDIEYVVVEYRLPALVISVKNSDGELIYSDKIQDSEVRTENYGDKDCNNWFPGIAEKKYEENKASFLASLSAKSEKALVEKADELIRNSLFARYADEEFKLGYIDEAGYESTTEAYQLAESAYAKLAVSGYDQSAIDQLNQAIALWEKDATESDLADRNARIGYKESCMLYENLAIAYMFTSDYDNSQKYFQKLKSTKKGESTTSIASHFSQVRNRAEQRIVGVSRNREILGNQESINALIASSNSYRNTIQITRKPNSEYTALLQQHNRYLVETGLDAEEFAAEASVNAGGNKYEPLVQFAALQGYTIMVNTFMNPQEFTELPAEMCQLEQLNEIRITSNEIASIAPEIGNLKNLKVLSLKGNKLTEVPAEIGNLKNLEKLNLANNSLTSLPQEIASLTNLETLDLKGNNFSNEEIARIEAALPDCRIKF